VTLPLEPPIKPQLALTRKQLPLGEEWAYEQKLDGFRAIVFVDGADTYIQSRGAKALGRYFPELSFAPGRYVLDGELVIRDAEGNLEFDALQSRIHPAESRIALLAREIPADYVAFDLLAETVKRLEEEGDSLYHEWLGKLFDGEPDPLTVIKWKEIYDNLEKTLDYIEDAGNVLESISIKHA